jgi:ABC-type transport system substrate-binding protein
MKVRIFLSALLIAAILFAGCIGKPAKMLKASKYSMESDESAVQLQEIAEDMQSGIDELSLALENQSMALENISDATIELDERTGDYTMNESSIILPRIAYASGQFEASARHSQNAKEYFASAQEKVSDGSVLGIVRDYDSVTFYVKSLADAGVNFTTELQKPEPDSWWSVAYHGGVYTWLMHQDEAFIRTGINRTDLHAYTL